MQCSDNMHDKLASIQDWDTIEYDMDLIGLLKGTWALCYKFKGHCNEFMAFTRAKACVYTFCQGKMTNEKCFK